MTDVALVPEDYRTILNVCSLSNRVANAAYKFLEHSVVFLSLITDDKAKDAEGQKKQEESTKKLKTLVRCISSICFFDTNEVTKSVLTFDVSLRRSYCFVFSSPIIRGGAVNDTFIFCCLSRRNLILKPKAESLK